MIYTVVYKGHGGYINKKIISYICHYDYRTFDEIGKSIESRVIHFGCLPYVQITVNTTMFDVTYWLNMKQILNKPAKESNV